MKNIKAPHLIFTIIAVILGAALYKQFDFETLKFEKPGLAIVYLIVFIFSIYGIVKNYRKRPKE